VAEKRIKWTKQQQNAIKHRGSDVLVTASAGTGKTAVLSGRCVDVVCDKSLCPDVLSILVLTFTNAAAEQMRVRIAEQLKAVFLEKKDPHLYHQLLLLGGSDIGTIHSFCKRLITEHFYKLGLDPAFRVIEGDEQQLLKAESLEKTIDWAWEQGDLQQPLSRLLYRRDLRTNDGFLSKITDISNFLDGVVFRQDWFRRAAILSSAADVFKTELGERQKNILLEKLQRIISRMQYAQKLCSQTGDDAWSVELQQTHIEPVRECIEFLNSDNWQQCAEMINNFKKPTTYTPKISEENVAEIIHDTVKNALDDFEGLSDLAILNPDYLNKVGSASNLQTKVLIRLVEKFDRLYSEAKAAINCLDFADLEHYALKLLTVEENDKLLPSETALALRRKYRYIFVDEYQDINGVQQAMIDALSGGGNVFVVGDVKQSIYAWRGAKPNIFLEHLKTASVDPKNAPAGLRIDLNTNWRSDKRILDFVNSVFSRIMTASFAKIDYDESAMLKPFSDSKAESSPENIVELHILDKQQDDSDYEAENEDIAGISHRRRQAAMIARRIRQMVGADTGRAEFQIYDKQQDSSRGVQYGDIVILMRSPAERVNDYVEILRLAGVPVSCEEAGGYFEATEISDTLSLLKVLDNPQRDIEMAAVLRSPFFKISDTELAKIRIHSRTADQPQRFYECVFQYCVNGADAELIEKLKEALYTIEQWRTLARQGSLADLIWRIYRRSGFLSFVSALPNGRMRKANLLKLHERAIQFEGFASSAGIASLNRFVGFIEKLQETGLDRTGTEPQAQAENAVRIMSVHKSKGLEFPVVFVAELNSGFNKEDVYKSDCLAGENGLLGLQIIDRESNSKLNSVAYQIVAEEKLSVSLEEEMRILYVAMTRAKERLVLTAGEKKNHCRNIVLSGFLLGGRFVPDWQLRTCKSHLDWLLYALSDRKNLHEIFGIEPAENVRGDTLFSAEFYEQSELERLSKYAEKLRKGKSKQVLKNSGYTQRDSELLAQIKKSLEWQYPFGKASDLPAKLSVTQLTHRSDEYVKIDYSRAVGRKPKTLLTSDSAGEIDGRLIGIVVHSVIAVLDLSKPVTERAVEQIKAKLLADGVMTASVAANVSAAAIVKFFETEPGRAALDRSNIVLREWPFTFAVPADDVLKSLFPAPYAIASASDETIVVQGVVDMVIESLTGLLVVDFKNDNITVSEVTGRAALYRQQLDFYSRAAEKILNKKVKSKWLYFLQPQSPVCI